MTSFPYVIRGDKKEIESFVINNQLMNFLWEAVPQIRRIFGSDAQLYLELSEYPRRDIRVLNILTEL